MNPIIKNILAVIVGFVVGSAVNMGIITLGSLLIAPPEGVNVTDMESLKSSMHLFGPQHFITPFLAHALGTLAGAFLAAKIATNHHMKFAMTIGVFFLIGVTMSVFMLPAPVWFEILDLSLAYIPMGWLGGKLGAYGKRYQ